MTLDSEALKLLLAVVEHGSFSAAARALGRVPSAVSMAVAQLEAELDLPLFDRSGREPRPTPQALALLPQARLLVDQLQQLNRHALALSQGLEPRLALAVLPELLAAAPWTQALARLSQEHPLLEVEVLAAPQADALDLLHSGRVQLALVFERPSLDSAEGFQEMGQETLVAVVAPGHALLQAAAPASALREQHLAAARQIVVAGRHGGDVDARIAVSRQPWRSDNPLAAQALVMAGLGWAWLPLSLVQPALDAGQLVRIPFENFSNLLQLWVDVVWSKRRPLGRAAQRLLALLSAAAAPKRG